jgi:BlaI family transcriptional regulator, penicillinase repressor
MRKNSKLTPAEWKIMEAVWELGGSPSVRNVIERAFPDGEKAYTTVQTVMNTLEKKGLLKCVKIGMVNFYTPVRTRDQMVKSEISLMASRMFKGSLPALANYLVNSEKLSLDEIEAIKSLLHRKEKELKGNRS